MPAEISNGNTSILLPLLALVVLVMVGLYVKARESIKKTSLVNQQISPCNALICNTLCKIKNIKSAF